MWNDPDHENNRAQSYTDTRNKWNNKSNNKQEEEKKDELIAFGYESFFFNNNGTAEAIEQGQLHITWQGQDPQDENALWLDRYDARNLLDDMRLFMGPRHILSDNFLHETSDLFHDRFQDLDSDEELLFHMDEDEREYHLAQKYEAEETSDYKGVQYNYEEDETKDDPVPVYNIHFEVPEGMIVPDSEKVLALIERTAKFVNSSSEPTMEIILQAKQATNPNFAFMSRRHHLYQFYKHIRRLMQMGLYETAEEARQREEDEAREAEEAEKEEQARGALKALKAEEATHVDIEKVIEKTVEFLCTNEEEAIIFEQKIHSLNDSRFGFMKPSNAWHQYYLKSKEDAKRDGTRYSLKDRLSNSASSNQFNHDSLLIGSASCQSNEEYESTSLTPSIYGSPKEIRAAEMRKLDRLQRVMELLKQKKQAENNNNNNSHNNSNRDRNSNLEGNEMETQESFTERERTYKIKPRARSRSSSISSNSSSSYRERSGSLSPILRESKRNRV